MKPTRPQGASTVTRSAARLSPSPDSGSRSSARSRIGQRLATALPTSPARSSRPLRQKGEAAT